jgi:hypothetical protein
MVSNDDVIAVVREAVRQFGADIAKAKADVLPTIVLSDAPPKIKVVTVIQGGNLTDSVRWSHDEARKFAKKWTVCVETWDGYATVAGERSDAILVNYWTEGRGPIFFVQRYTRRPFEWVGAAIAGEGSL